MFKCYPCLSASVLNAVCGVYFQCNRLLTCRLDDRVLGGGAMLLVIENSTHDSYNDVLALFSTRLGWFLRRVSFLHL